MKYVSKLFKANKLKKEKIGAFGISTQLIKQKLANLI
jgi:hypothetical protein